MTSIKWCACLLLALTTALLNALEIETIPAEFIIESSSNDSADKEPVDSDIGQQDSRKKAVPIVLEPISGPSNVKRNTKTIERSKADAAKPMEQESSQCPDMDKAFKSAKGLATRSQRDAAESIYVRLLQNCPLLSDRIIILQKVNEVIGTEKAVALANIELDRSSKSSNSKFHINRLKSWLFDMGSLLASEKYKKRKYASSLTILLRNEHEIKRRKSIGLGRLIAENSKKLGKSDQSIQWREVTRSWSKDNKKYSESEDVVALIWLHMEKQNLDFVNKQLNYATDKQKSLYFSYLARQYFEEQDYRSVLISVDKAERFDSGVKSEHLVIRAWSRFHLGEFDKANSLFYKLYQDSGDIDSAQGWFYSQIKLGELSQALKKFEKDGGPLGKIADDLYVHHMLSQTVNKISTDTLSKKSKNGMNQNDSTDVLSMMIATARAILSEHIATEMSVPTRKTDSLSTQQSIWRIEPITWLKKSHNFARRLSLAYESLADSNQPSKTNHSDSPVNTYLISAVFWREKAKDWLTLENTLMPNEHEKLLKEDLLALVGIYLRLDDLATVKELEKEIVLLDSKAAQDLRNELNSRYAQKAFDQEKYQKALDHLHLLADFRDLSVNERELLGWTQYRLSDYSDALESFSKAYRQEPTSRSIAQGLMFSAYQDDDLEMAAALALEYESVSSQLKQHFYDEETLLLADAGLNKEDAKISSLGVVSQRPNDISRFVSVAGLKVQYRSGEMGTSRLLTTRTPSMRARWKPNRGTAVGVSVDAVQLHTGSIGSGVEVGSRTDSNTCPSGIEPNFQAKRDCDRSQQPMESTSLMLEPEIQFTTALGDWASLQLATGATPMTGVVSSISTGKIRLGLGDSDGGFGFGWRRDSLTESLLSYTGQKDPYSEATWGRVVESKLFLEGYSQIAESWKLNFSLSHSVLSGKSVTENRKNSVTGSMAYAWPINRKTKMKLGPELSYAGHDENLGGFTLGHGGYFSPQAMIKGSINMDMIYQPKSPWFIKGRFYPGYQFQMENCLKDFTRADESCYRGSQQNQGFNSKIAIGGLTQLKKSSHYAGADFQFSSSPNYNDWQIWLFWQYAWAGDDLPSLFEKASGW